MPPRERYRLDGRQPWVAFWNLFDATVFTPEAIEFHRRRLKWIPVSFGTLAALWIVLDTIW